VARRGRLRLREGGAHLADQSGDQLVSLLLLLEALQVRVVDFSRLAQALGAARFGAWLRERGLP
jgi:hypothetical protein